MTVLDKIKDLAGQVTVKAGPALKQATDKAGPLLQQAVTKAGPILKQATDNAGPLLQQAVTKAGPILKQATDRLSQSATSNRERMPPGALPTSTPTYRPAPEGGQQDVVTGAFPVLSATKDAPSRSTRRQTRACAVPGRGHRSKMRHDAPRPSSSPQTLE
jgi:cell division septum initiation protein DivIVA